MEQPVSDFDSVGLLLVETDPDLDSEELLLGSVPESNCGCGFPITPCEITL